MWVDMYLGVELNEDDEKRMRDSIALMQDLKEGFEEHRPYADNVIPELEDAIGLLKHILEGRFL